MVQPGTWNQPNNAKRQLRLARQSSADISLGLSRIADALVALGQPQRKIPPVIHVAGTNGKGSTIAFMRAILEAGGYAVHSFTSPAIFHAGEQIYCAGTSLSADALDQITDEIEATGCQLTPFETLTAAAFLAFSKSAADVTLLETGMGGAEDATNIIENPALTVLTPIAMDHAAHLGPHLRDIARAKAGIFKPRAPAVIAAQSGDVLQILEEEAAQRGVNLIRQGMEWMAFAQGGRLVFQDSESLIDLPLPALQGRHQITNAGLAIASIRALAGLGVSEESIEAGLLGARWPGRLEPLRKAQLVAKVAPSSEGWVDAGHNPHAAGALAEFAADRGAWDEKPLILIVAMLKDKDAEGFFRPFVGLAAHTIAIALTDDERAADPKDLCEAAQAAGLDAAPAASLSDAFDRLAALQRPLRILICGSLGVVRAVEQVRA